MAAEYALTADALLNFGRNPPSGERAFVRWASFADRVGPSVLPFVIRPDRLDAVPFKALGLTPVRLSDMVPQPDEMWVLFCFRDSFRDALPTDSPLRADGFPLVLEWRRGQGDSELLSGAFHELADRVRGQFGEGGREWGLHPAFDRYGDAVAFTDPDLTPLMFNSSSPKDVAGEMVNRTDLAKAARPMSIPMMREWQPTYKPSLGQKGMTLSYFPPRGV